MLGWEPSSLEIDTTKLWVIKEDNKEDGVAYHPVIGWVLQTKDGESCYMDPVFMSANAMEGETLSSVSDNDEGYGEMTLVPVTPEQWEAVRRARTKDEDYTQVDTWVIRQARIQSTKK